MLVNDTPIGHDHRHGRATRVDEPSLQQRLSVRARDAGRNWATSTLSSGRVRLRRRPSEGRRQPTTDAAAYGGSATRFRFAIYLASKDGYEVSALPTGVFAGAPEDALDTACGLYLGDPTAWI
jgi:hypothetical protein